MRICGCGHKAVEGVGEGSIPDIKTDISTDMTKLDRAGLLPVEVLELILCLLSPGDLKAAVLVCRRWREVAEAPGMWTWVNLTLNYKVKLLPGHFFLYGPGLGQGLLFIFVFVLS